MGFSVKPYLEKGMELELFGHYSNSDKSIRKSFTATNYRLLNLDQVKSQLPKSASEANQITQIRPSLENE